MPLLLSSNFKNVTQTVPVLDPYQGIILEELAEAGDEDVEAAAGEVIVTTPYRFQYLLTGEQFVSVSAEIADEFSFPVSKFFNNTLAVKLKEAHIQGTISNYENALGS